ncbi:MAG: zinc-ribbon domain-containing protein [Clostridia bacterium]|nr:zinc-ribbon domain-containing protein [Clostridia bacterium]
MICNNCGKELKTATKFCPKCGSAISNYTVAQVVEHNHEKNTEQSVRHDVQQNVRRNVGQNVEHTFRKNEVKANSININYDNLTKNNVNNAMKSHEINSLQNTGRAVQQKAERSFIKSQGEAINSDGYSNLYENSLNNVTKLHKKSNSQVTTNSVTQNAGQTFIQNKDTAECFNDNYDDLDSTNMSNAQKKREDVSSQKISIPKKILSVFICLLISVFAFSLTICCVARIELKEQKIQDIIQNADMTAIKISKGNEELYLSDYILSNIDLQFMKEYNLTGSKIDEILNDDKTVSLIASIATEYTSMFVFGEKPKKLDANAIINDIKSIENLIYSKTGYRLSANDYEEIKKEIYNGELSFLDESKIEEIIGFDPYLPSKILSIPMICVLSVLIVGFIIVLLKINNWKAKSAYSFFRITLIILGVVDLALATFLVVIALKTSVLMLVPLLNKISLILLICAFVLLLLGIVPTIIRHKLSKNKTKEGSKI